MSLKVIYITVTDASLTIYETNEKYIPKTTTVYKIVDSSEIYIPSQELGEKFLRIEDLQVGDMLKVIFKPISAANINEDIVIRLARLEKEIEDLKAKNNILEAALSNRINITAFQAWISLIEKKLGFSLIDDIGSLTSTLTRLREL